MDSGWIKVYRKIMENEHYFKEPFCKNMAWIDLLLLANHKQASIRKRGITLNINRGEVGLSETELAKRWRWSRRKVDGFLKELKKAHQIAHQKNNVTTLITILNYVAYQQKAPQIAHEEAPQKHRKSTADLCDELNDNALQAPKNVKNDKNLINSIVRLTENQNFYENGKKENGSGSIDSGEALFAKRYGERFPAFGDSGTDDLG